LSRTRRQQTENHKGFKKISWKLTRPYHFILSILGILLATQKSIAKGWKRDRFLPRGFSHSI
jgi:hypothetical protein